MNKIDWIIIFAILLSVVSVIYYVENFTGENKEIMGTTHITAPKGYVLNKENYDHYTLNNGSNQLDIRIFYKESVDYLIHNYLTEHKDDNVTQDTMVINANDKINKVKLVANNTTDVNYYFRKNNVTYQVTTHEDIVGTYGTDYQVKELFRSMI